MTDTTGRRADTTRQVILRAAAHQFAARAYHEVGLDDILAEAELTKGAMYFHFPSKHALALAIIEQQNTADDIAIQDLLNRKLSGLESLVDFCYMIAIQDMSQDMARAGLRLIESVGRADGIAANTMRKLAETLTEVVRRAVAEGDIVEQCDPQALGLLLLSLYLGLRQTSDLDRPEQFLLDVEKTVTLVLPGVVTPNRVEYFRQFIRRRTALAIRSVSAQADAE